jgi:hypothetical protein
MSNLKKNLALSVLGISSFVFSLAFSVSSNAGGERSKFQGEFTGNCYCNISGRNCQCVIMVEGVG